MKSYLLSQLTFRFATKDLKTFVAAYDHDWLLWEPGAWKPPQAATVMILEAVTRPPATASGEALALALIPGKQGSFTLGRGAECDASINDGTLSQLHLVFMRAPNGVWTVRDAGSKNGSWLDGRKLEAGRPQELREGNRVIAAQVAFTYYSPTGMLGRIKRP